MSKVISLSNFVTMTDLYFKYLLCIVSSLFICIDLPIISSPPTSLTGVDGSPAMLDVQIDTNPFLDSVTVVTPSQQAAIPASCLNQSAGTVSIQFPRVNRYNMGKYTITVSNTVGSESGNFQMIVHCK